MRDSGEKRCCWGVGVREGREKEVVAVVLNIDAVCKEVEREGCYCRVRVRVALA